MQATARRRDPLRRLTPTSHAMNLRVMNRSVRVETNSGQVLSQTQRVFRRYGEGWHSEEPEFLWKIMSDPDAGLAPPWPQISAFSDNGLRFVNIGQRSFLAIDLEAREAVAHLAEGLAEDDTGFASPFLTTLFCLTAGALRLTPLAAACVTKGNKALLVLGMPNNGKTTSSYLAARLGLEFYADRAVFLDLDGGGLRVWGDFAAAAFRAQTSEFLPELQTLGRPFQYQGRRFLYVENSTSIRSNGHPVIPVSCVFLERGVANIPRLRSLNRAEAYRRLMESLPFRDDARFEALQQGALSALAQVPACCLAYGNDPAAATTFFPSLLASSDLFEPKE